MIRLLMVFISYFCVASVLSAVVGLGFMMQSGMLTNEKMFQMYAVMHDVNLQEVEEAHVEEGETVPKEERSLSEVHGQRSVLQRDSELRSEQLRRQLSEFRHIRDLLATEMDRRDGVAQTLENRLSQAEENAIEEGKAEVARHFSQMEPSQVKQELTKMIDADEMDRVVFMLGQMGDTQRKKVLRQFTSDEDITTLHKIHRLMADGFPKKQVVEETRNELNAIQNESN